ncbi:MAG: hypothetical protein EBY83_02160 [Verrucomicrobia bacterium]|nr:hypothetical protein [Verrucomicrobiota bacterium]
MASLPYLHLSPARLRTTLTRFRSLRALVVGDLMLDEFIYGRVSRISPEAPVPVVHVEREQSYPGGAANVARNLAALGIHAELSGGIGQDATGQHLLTLLRHTKIGTSGVFRSAKFPTIRKTRILSSPPSEKPGFWRVTSKSFGWIGRNQAIYPQKREVRSSKKPYRFSPAAMPSS